MGVRVLWYCCMAVRFGQYWNMVVRFCRIYSSVVRFWWYCYLVVVQYDDSAICWYEFSVTVV